MVNSQEAEDTTSEVSEDLSEVNLKSLFSIGQYLRAHVNSTEQEQGSGSRTRRHIELSLLPSEVNVGLNKSNIVVDSMIQASVVSVEDHGLVMNLGLKDKSIRGFISSKELGNRADMPSVMKGAVYLCLVVGVDPHGNVIQLSADDAKAGNIKTAHYLANAPSIESFLPGTAVEMLISETNHTGVLGKVMGLLDVVSDLIHSGAATRGKEFEKNCRSGNRVIGRILYTLPETEGTKVGISLLNHIVSLKPVTLTSDIANVSALLERMPLSTVLEDAKVIKVQPGYGLFLEIGIQGVQGFVHISKVMDGRTESLSESTGAYKVGSIHKARVIGYNSMDGLFIISLEPSVIDQRFLRLEDVKIGDIVDGTIKKLIINETGLTGLLIKIAEVLNGYVSVSHFADVPLQHPERKFKEGLSVKARVLSISIERRKVRLTLKKSIVNSDAQVWDSYENLKPGLEAPGTVVNVMSSGAIVQFYGLVRGFLPVSEMSEAYIQDPKQHFRVGQAVTVHIISVDPVEKRLLISCRDSSELESAQTAAIKEVNVAALISGTISEKTEDKFVIEVGGSRLKAFLPFEHLADGSSQKCLSLAKRIRIGQVLKELLVLNKNETKRFIHLSSKPSLVKAAKDGRLPKSLDDIKVGDEAPGYVKNITSSGVFVQYAANLTGLLFKSQLPDEAAQLPDFGLRRHQSIAPKIRSVDFMQQRFLLTLKPPPEKLKPAQADSRLALSNPVDENLTSTDDLIVGKLTKARVKSVKESQLNVELADGVQGRVDVSEVFDSWEEIKDPKHPLKAFTRKQIINVRVLGMHDTRNHRFLPITNRAKSWVFELSTKPSNLEGSDLDILTIDQVETGSTRLVYVNNVSLDSLWVNLSPNVRGRIRALDVSDDISLASELSKHFPIGSALKARVTLVDIANNRLDLSARSEGSTKTLILDDLSPGMVLPGRVTKVCEYQITVQLSETIAGPVHLIDLGDDFSKADPMSYQKNQYIHVCVKAVDIPNKKLTLSTRPSKVLSSSLPVEDIEVTSISQLKVNQILRGFIKNVADQGVFINIGSAITTFVRVSDLSDLFLKDWKSGFQVHQLVKGKIIAIDRELNHVQMSLKQSHIDKDYKPPVLFADMEVSKIVTGKIRKVEEYGVFIVVDGSANVSGLCHRTQMADSRAPDPKKLYNEGDAVQAKVLKIDQTKKQISFGLKASYFSSEQNENTVSGESDDRTAADEAHGASLANVDEHEELAESNRLNVSDTFDELQTSNSGFQRATENNQSMQSDKSSAEQNGHHKVPGLSVGGFDWTGGMAALDEQDSQSATDDEELQPKKKRRRKAEIQVDRTGDLDAQGPQSVADFERLLMGQPNSSVLWLSYMAFHLQLDEVSRARELAERALRTINMQEQTEKFNVWIALLNLENAYGTDESLDAVFKRACQHNDGQEVHERLISIYIQSGKLEVILAHSSPRVSLFVFAF